MSTQIHDSFLQIVNRKAKRMKEELEADTKYKALCQALLNDKDLLNKTKLDQLQRAFLIGAIDAMIFDVASALAFLNYARNKSRKELIKNIDW
jgi:hypothetical protein